MYVGANVGYGFNANNGTLLETTTFPGVIPGVNVQGAFGGGQLGYNWQDGNLVFGAETDIQGANVVGRKIYDVPGYAPSRTDVDVGYFGTVRARLGYAAGHALFYATGGLAYGNVNYFVKDNANIPIFRGNDIQTGYVVGGGLEYMMTANWSWKAEYQYINLGSFTVGLDPSSPLTNLELTNATANFHTVRIGVNYKFGG